MKINVWSSGRDRRTTTPTESKHDDAIDAHATRSRVRRTRTKEHVRDEEGCEEA